MSRARLIAVGVLLHCCLQLAPAYEEVRTNPRARDFASYYYALQVARRGGDPYDTAALGDAANAQHTRRTVNPYFYPPPFLLTLSWAAPLSLKQAYLGMLVLNELSLGCYLWVALTQFAAPAWAVLLVLATFTPLTDHARMGQANLLTLLAAVGGVALARKRPWAGGALVGLAAMCKMSPILYLGWFALRREWKPIVAAGLSAVALSLAALPLVGFSTQLRFYTVVLPGFGRGDYHDLTVPLTLWANHSIPDIFNRLWPGPTGTSLSTTAEVAAKLTAAALFSGWLWCYRRGDDAPRAIGALTLLMAIIPAYTYEHHLVFLLPAILAAAGPSPWFIAGYMLLAPPLDFLHWLDAHLAGPHWLVREAKFVGELLLLGALLPRKRSALDRT